MGAGRKTHTVHIGEKLPSSPMNGNFSVSAKNLRKVDLGGVIFGCKHNTMSECLAKQLFGLPSMHFSYVKNVQPGLPLFLFNYSDRKLHGIYEAASHGQMNIDSYAWTDDGTERTPYPSQVRIHIRMQCNPLIESQFRKIIEDNYYSSQHFWFELDHAQTRGLTALFLPSAVKPTYLPAAPASTMRVKHIKSSVPSSWSDLFKAVPSTISNTESIQECVDNAENNLDLYIENNLSSLNLNDRHIQLSSSYKTSSVGLLDMKQKEPVSDWEELVDDNDEVSHSGANTLWNGTESLKREQSCNVNLDTDGEEVLLKLKMLSANRSKGCMNGKAIPYGPEDMHKNDVIFSEEPDILAEKEEHLAASNLYHGNTELVQIVKELKERTTDLERQQVESNQEIKQLRDRVRDSERIIQLLKFQLKEVEPRYELPLTLDCSMSELVEQCLGSENVIYLIGGFNGSRWLSALDSFSPSLDILTPLKSMSRIRSYASGVSLGGNLYVFGGGDSSSWSDSVECYNPRRDEWTLCPNMNHEKGSLAGVTLNNKIFAIGGGDGKECFSNVEMFDPALGRWINSQSMLQKRFAPAASELQGVLYAVGGFDGNNYLKSAERFDPREGYWTKLPSLNTSRGCHSLVTLNEKLYAIGGYDGEKMVSSVEIFDPRLDSWVMGEPMNFVRGYAATVVLGDTLLAIGGVKDGHNIVETVECYKEGSGWAATGLKGVGKRCFCSAVVL